MGLAPYISQELSRVNTSIYFTTRIRVPGSYFYFRRGEGREERRVMYFKEYTDNNLEVKPVPIISFFIAYSNKVGHKK
jgi:hypothetical protein